MMTLRIRLKSEEGSRDFQTFFERHNFRSEIKKEDGGSVLFVYDWEPSRLDADAAREFYSLKNKSEVFDGMDLVD